MLHSSFPMFLFWGDELTCFYNDAYRPSLGVAGKHPAIGKPPKEVWSEIWDVIHPMIRDAIDHGRATWREDQRIPIFRNGEIEEVYWTFSYSPAYGDDATICGVLVTCMETTERVHAKKNIEQIVSERTVELEEAKNELQRSNKYLQTVIDIFKEPLQVIEPVFENDHIIDFVYVITNQAYSAYANKNPDALVGKRVGELFPGYFHTSSFEFAVDTYKTGMPHSFEIHYDVDGLDIYNMMSTTKFGNQVLIHFTDFTRLKQLQIELMRKIEELTRSNQNLEEFAHAASHDLKEPIRKIHVFVNMLKNQLSEHLMDQQLETFEKIERATNRMGLLVDDLLVYSHVSERPLEKEDVDIEKKIRMVMEELELDIQQKNAIIRTKDLPVVRGYKRQLQQLLQNLIGNALKYSKEGIAPVIEVSGTLREENGIQYHVIEVCDNGIGFEQEYADKIFHMFTRLHGKSKYSGTGVGLAIAKRVIENHNGFIRAYGKLDQGARFEIYLPVE